MRMRTHRHAARALAALASGVLLAFAGYAFTLAPAAAPAPCNPYLESCTPKPPIGHPRVSLVLGHKCLEGRYRARPKINGGKISVMKAWIGKKRIARVKKHPFVFYFSTRDLRPNRRYRMKVSVRFKTPRVVWRSTTAAFKTCR